MKRTLSLLFALLMLMLPVLVVAEPVTSTDVTVKVNGAPVVFPDQGPIIQNDRTYVPVRAVTETLKAEVTWDNDTRTAFVRRNGIQLAIAIGNKEIDVTMPDGAKTVVIMDVEPIIVSDRTLLPIRFVVESLGAQVGWNDKTRTVLIVDESLKVSETPQTPEVQTKQVTSLQMSDRDVTMDRFDTLELILTAEYADGSRVTVTQDASWRSSSSSIVTVDKGLATAKNYGTAVVTATYGGKSASCNITVEAVDAGIDNIFTSSRFVSVEEENSQYVTAMVNFSDGIEKDITEEAEWRSGDEAVAVAENGNIYGIAKGSTVVTVHYEGYEVSIFVTVTPKPEDFSDEDLSKVVYNYKGDDYLVYAEGAGLYTEILQYNDLADSFDASKAVENGKYVVLQTKAKGPMAMMAMDLCLKYNPEVVKPTAVKFYSNGTADSMGTYGEKGFDKDKVTVLCEEVMDEVDFEAGQKITTLTTREGDPVIISTFYRIQPVVLEEQEEFYVFNTYFEKVDGMTLSAGDIRLSDDVLMTTLYAFDDVTICYGAEVNLKDKKWIPDAFYLSEIQEYQGPVPVDFVIGIDTETTLTAGSTAGIFTSVTFDDGTTNAPEVTVRSSDENVAYVEGGVLFTVAPGTATISATYGGLESTFDIIVTE